MKREEIRWRGRPFLGNRDQPFLWRHFHNSPMEGNTIIRDLRVLTEDFIPSRIVHRDGQLKALRDCLAPVIESRRPRHSFLYGPPGTGKTCLSLYVVEELKKAAPIVAGYINCWQDSTRFRVFHNLLSVLGRFAHRKGTPTDELLEEYRKATRGRACVVILDEIDHLENSDILYDLLECGAGLVIIANSESALRPMDSRIQSRLTSLERIQFRPYSTDDLVEILMDRAGYGLVPGAVGVPHLKMIASRAQGDARAALMMLSWAAQRTEASDLKRIPSHIIEKAFPAMLRDSKHRTLERLTPHQRIILTVLESGRKESGGACQRF